MNANRCCARWLTRFMLPVVLTLLGMVAVQPAWAQCGDRPPDSSCITCHEATDPVSNLGEWHIIHAQKDCCWNCHGGNTQTSDKELAHEGMTRLPLEDTRLSCYPCHPDDYQSRAERFGAILGVQPVSHEPTPRPTAPPRNGKGLQPVILPASEEMQVEAFSRYSAWVVLALAIMFFAGFWLWKHSGNSGQL